MIERPLYRALDFAPGRYFDCKPHHATISSEACAKRWALADPASQCSGCEVGRLHHADHRPADTIRQRRADGTCQRCGRTDLRIIKVAGLCVSCHNREIEWRKGRNAKGKAPVLFEPLRAFEVAVQLADASERRHLVDAAHGAEAIGRALRDMPPGAELQQRERRETVWNPNIGAFEHVCDRCGVAGLVLERRRGRGILEHHRWCCSGEPVGPGWRLAEVRKLQFGLHPNSVAAWLNMGGHEAAREPMVAWQPTEHPCTCGAGQVEGLLTAPGGRWRTRCITCGARSEQN